jgi:hypothetical protein
MRPPTERDDWIAYRDAAAWLRDFTDQKNIERGRVMCGGNWFTPQQIQAVRERARRRGPPTARETQTITGEA